MKKYVLKIGDKDYTASVLEIDDTSAKISVDGNIYEVNIKEFELNGKKPAEKIRISDKLENMETGTVKTQVKKNTMSGDGIKAPMPGVILDIRVKKGERIKAGDDVLIIEAMKMENEIKAPYDGIVGNIHINVNDSVSEYDLLVELKRPAMTTL